MAHFELWLCARQVQLVSRSAESLATPTMLTSCMCMLRSAATRAAELSSGGGHDMACYEAACQAMEQLLCSASSRRALSASAPFSLPAGDAAHSPDYRLPLGVLPPITQPGPAVGGLDAARRSRDGNLGSVPLLPASSLTPNVSESLIPFPRLLSALQAWSKSGVSVEAQLALRCVESQLFQRAALDFDSSSDSALRLVLDSEQAALLDVVDEYRSLQRRFLTSDAGQGRMQAEGRSRELLVVWVAYCLLDASARSRHGNLFDADAADGGGYGVSLHWQDLRHLKLADHEAVDAALATSTYLFKHSKAGRELFSLRDQGQATFGFAQAYAAKDSAMTAILKEEEKVAEARRQSHWQEVQEKQRLAASIRVELASLWQQFHALESASNVAYRNYINSKDRYGNYNQYLSGIDDQCRSARDACNAQISAKGAALKVAETPPPPILQPLPRDSKLALGWLFFLHMPPLFRRLSRASLLAQQLLLPVPPDSHEEQWKSLQVKPYQTSLVSYYEVHRLEGRYALPAQHDSGSDGHVSLHSRGKQCDSWPNHVDSFYGPDDGVWYPDSLHTALGWKSSGSATDEDLGLASVGFFDPFQPVDQEVLELSFTEELQDSDLQFAMHTRKDVASTPLDRSNLAVARQDARPHWLSKPAWLSFGSLRSYPMGQMRRLCDALRQREMPLAQPDVIALIRQSVYHIGTLSPSADGLLWRTDWQLGGDLLPALCQELQELASELKHTPRDHDATLILGEVAAFLSMWHLPFRKVAREFSDMTRCSADQMEAQIEKAAAKSAVQQQLQARQCHLRMLSLLCFGPGAMDSVEDAAVVVQLMVQIKHRHVFLDEVPEQDAATLRSLHFRCHDVTARHAAALVQLAEKRHGRQLLTDATAKVLERTPSGLAWERLVDTASFEAVGSDGHLYSINLLDGTVLLDGVPPGRLPLQILKHPLYSRTFGDRNFEVARTAAGVLETLKPIKGRFYNFLLFEGQLVVTELDKKKVCVT